MFSFKSVGHFFATAFHDIKVGVADADKFIQKERPVIEAGVNTAVAITSVVDPSAALLAQSLERAGEAVLGEVAATLQKADAATTANGLNVTLDADFVAELKTLLADVEALKPGTQATATAVGKSLATSTPAKV